MFVKAVFWRRCLPDFMCIIAEKSPTKLLAFWQSQLELKPWAELIAAARATNYNGVERLLSQILPKA
jgi:hypothetical protein